jgi:5-formyltetrahydrofolate cyclo-ligase
MVNVAEAKAELRTRLLRARAQMEPAIRAEASAAIRRRLEGLPELTAPQTVCAYGAVGDEVDIDDFLRALLAAGTAVCLPWVAERGLGVSRIRDLDGDLAAGFAGLREPPPQRREPVRPDELDAVIAPGVGFDRRGNRLGYGGAYFDGLIGELRPGTPVVGVGYEAQITDAIPVTSHDRRVTVLATEAGAWRASASGD